LAADASVSGLGPHAFETHGEGQGFAALSSFGYTLGSGRPAVR